MEYTQQSCKRELEIGQGLENNTAWWIRGEVEGEMSTWIKTAGKNRGWNKDMGHISQLKEMAGWNEDMG